jgi:hypothetical protein
MESFSYLVVLVSIILAMGLTRILSSIGKMLELRRQVTFYWVHLLWALNLFLWIVLEWWVLFRWNTQHTWSFYLFAFLLLAPTLSFLASVILLPDPKPETDYHTLYYTNRRWFFAIASLLPLIDAVDTLLKGTTHFLAQGPIYILTILLVTSLSIIAIITPNQKYHKAFSIFFLLYIIAFITINLSTLA